MKKLVIAALAATTAIGGVLPAGVAAAQPGYYQDDNGDHRDRDRDHRDQGNRDQGNRDQGNRDQGYRDQGYRDQGYRDQGDRDRGYRVHDERGGHDRWDQDARRWRDEHHYRYWGGDYGYQGYRGNWRAGERYPYWRDRRYQIEDWHAYSLPPPRPGYAYYRDPNGDVVMAAVASGLIGLIIGGALGDQGYHHR